MNATAKVRAFLRLGRAATPPMLDTIFYHAARIDGAGFAELFSEPTRLTAALLDQHRLFGSDAIAVRIDEVVLAPALGLPIDWEAAVPVVQWAAADTGDWPPDPDSGEAAAAVLIEVVGRLAAEMRRQVPVMAVLPGPGRIAARSGGDDGGDRASRLLRALADAVCRAGANIVLLEEDGEVPIPLLTPIVNTIRYYNAFPILAAAQAPDKVPADAVLMPEQAWRTADPAPRRCGVSVPADCLGDADRLAAFTARLRTAAAPVFLSMADDVVLAHPTADGVALHRSLGGLTFDSAT